MEGWSGQVQGPSGVGLVKCSCTHTCPLWCSHNHPASREGLYTWRRIEAARRDHRAVRGVALEAEGGLVYTDAVPRERDTQRGWHLLGVGYRV